MKHTLLLIDDDADIRESFADLFVYSGWTVGCAADGIEALEWLAAHERPDVILLDLKMPRCDGYEFRERQLADPRWKDIPTVIFTADTQVDGADLPSLRVATVVRKSVELAQLLTVLDRACEPSDR